MSIQHKKVKQKLEEKKSLTFLYKKKYDFISKALGETKLYSIDELINLGLPVFQLSTEPCYYRYFSETLIVYVNAPRKPRSYTKYISNYGGQVLNIIVNYNNNTFVFPILVYLSYYSAEYQNRQERKNNKGDYEVIHTYHDTRPFPPTEKYLFYTGTKPQFFKFLYFNFWKNIIREVEGTYDLFLDVYFNQKYWWGDDGQSPYLKLRRIYRWEG